VADKLIILVLRNHYSWAFGRMEPRIGPMANPPWCPSAQVILGRSRVITLP